MRRQLGAPPSDPNDAVRKSDLDAAAAVYVLYRVETPETVTVASGRGLIALGETVINGRIIVNGIVRML